MAGIDNPRQILLDLRKTASERYPDAEEVFVPSDNMKPVHSLDINLVYKEECISNVFEIMYDDEANTFMLYGYDREDGIPEQDEDDLVTSYMESHICEDIEVVAKRKRTAEDVAAFWSMTDAHLSQVAHERIKELGGDPDLLAEAITLASLHNPDLDQ